VTETDTPFQPPDPFRCETGRAGDTDWVRPVGELDLDTEPQLEEAIATVREQGAPRLLLDLSKLTFMDSTGLRLVIRWDTAAKAQGFGLAIVRGPDVVQRVIRLTGMEDQLTFAEAPPDENMSAPGA
jgi:anti-sigma B factor antagonist